MSAQILPNKQNMEQKAESCPQCGRRVHNDDAYDIFSAVGVGAFLFAALGTALIGDWWGVLGAIPGGFVGFWAYKRQTQAEKSRRP